MIRLRPSLLRATCALLALGLSASGTEAARPASDWKVIKVGKWDYLSVDNIAKFYGFPGPVEPVNKSIRLDNGRIQLEVTLDSREAIINGVRNWLCFPVIAHSDGRFLVSRIDLAKTFEPQFRPHMIGNVNRFTTVVLDAGHGGVEKGAASNYGLEKNFTLAVARELKPLLEAKGLRVVMTRTGDELVPLPERARIANSTRDCIFVSIHFNATNSNASASGFEIFSLTPRGAPSTQDNRLMAHFANPQKGSPVDAASLALSTAVYHSMLAHMPEFDRGVKRARFAVLRLTQVPAILIEGGFLTERQESRNIANSEWRAKLAQSIAVGIENYRGLVEKKQRPMLLADYRRQYEGVLVARNPSAPLATDASAIVPASNAQTTGMFGRLTAALSRQAAPQTAGSEHHDEDDQDTEETAPSKTIADTPEATPDAGLNTVLRNPAKAPHSDVLAAAGMENMPPAPEEISPPEDYAPAVAAADEPPSPAPESMESAAAPEPAPNPPPPPGVVRKYWVLKFDPPPKFRQ
jgi:N-acetylmuramoyl-L-alanine amidase